MSLMFLGLLTASLIACDQLIKHWAGSVLKPVGSIMLIPGLIKLTYVENFGAAFGMLQGKRWILIWFTGAFLALIAFLLATNRIQKNIERFSAALILAGGAGNLADRIRQGYVVDYLDINELFSYPMFNLADCCVVVGAALILIWTVKEEISGRRASVKDMGEEIADCEPAGCGDTESETEKDGRSRP